MVLWPAKAWYAKVLPNLYHSRCRSIVWIFFCSMISLCVDICMYPKRGAGDVRKKQPYTLLPLLVGGCKTLLWCFLRKMNCFTLKFRTFSVFSIRSCMIFNFFFYILPFSCALEPFRFSTMDWLAQLIWITESYCLWVCHNAFGLFFFFSFFRFFFFFLWSFHTGFVSAAHSGSRAAKFPWSIRTTTDPAMCATSLVQAACNGPDTSISLLPPFLSHPLPFLPSLQWDEKSAALNVYKMNPI